ncbi:site-specific integrase [Nocardia sp. NEAU-G5]|uniref:Site-specific integrase n=1 Tax=Nocardia albiluteola TaxID=2842303 RepID=A0ABS6AY60_9NOCA|nr:tyrosine-type recombinase/integrase [Nocardia albiluteola]MBU3061934.1 site-specific integrase [Nocardia albiluteola]
MLVQRVLTTGSSLDSWNVLGDGGPVEPIERYLAYMTDIERSPNTIKAYAHDLKDWFVYLDIRGLDWREVRLEDLGEFVSWLRLPPAGRAGGVAVLPSAQHHCSAVTINRKLSAVGGLYTFHARHGVDLGDLVTELAPAQRRRSGWKPFLFHLSGGKPERRRTIKLAAARKRPTLITATQVQAILDSCTRLRDRFLWALLWDSGIRIGEALGLRHEDLAVAERELTVTRRINDNRARAKSPQQRTVPISAELVRLYADYLQVAVVTYGQRWWLNRPSRRLQPRPSRPALLRLGRNRGRRLRLSLHPSHSRQRHCQATIGRRCSNTRPRRSQPKYLNRTDSTPRPPTHCDARPLRQPADR